MTVRGEKQQLGNIICFHSGQQQKNNILYEELSCKGRNGSKEVIKHELISDISACISKTHI